MLGEMRRIAASAGFSDLVAPVRPSLKSLYPLTAMERYASLDIAGRASVRPVASRARASRRRDPADLSAVDGDYRHGRGLGELDRDAVSREWQRTSFGGRCSPSRSTSRPIAGRTSSPTSGCTTRSPDGRQSDDFALRPLEPVVQATRPVRNVRQRRQGVVAAVARRTLGRTSHFLLEGGTSPSQLRR